jgi:M6 family metalloprotease-like protein
MSSYEPVSQRRCSMRFKTEVGLVILLSLVAALTSIMAVPSAQSAQRSHIGTNQRVLVVCAMYSDEPTTRLATCNDWVTLLNTEANDFYDRATFGQTTFIFETAAGGPASGWYSLGYPYANYNFGTTGQDAITLIDPDVNFSNYDRVLVITNWQDFRGQGSSFREWTVSEGIEHYRVEGGVSVGKRVMSMAIVNEWRGSTTTEPRNYDQAGSVASHELGHELSLPTHYGDIRWHPGLSRDVITPWDIMGISPGINHFIGWAKSQRGWIPGWTGAASPRIQTVGPPVGADIDTTITISPQETFTAGGTQIVRIPFTPLADGAPFHGYVLENRRQTNGDENLPSEGILVSLVNENPTNILKCIVMEDPAAANLDLAPLTVGDTFDDASRNLTVTVQSQSGNNYTVRIQYLLPPSAKPDPMIIPWGHPPYETVDIWVDSEKNGWDTYRYTDGGGNPVGNGDDAWVDHNNRVYVRIRNIGPGVATNVRVQVRKNDPPGMGDAGPDWKNVGTIIFPVIDPGDTVEDYVIWKPTVGQHTCLDVRIEDIAGELSTANNAAQENVNHFDTSGDSPYYGTGQRINVYNPLASERVPVYFNVKNVPPDWAVLVYPPSLTLEPGGKDSVFYMVLPSGPPEHPRDSEQMDQRIGFTAETEIQAYVPYADTFIPIGGVDLWTHLVDKTRIQCEARRLATAAVTLISGRLTPAVADARIAVELLVDGRTEIRHVDTNAEGMFTVSGLPSGTTKAWAYFSGDAQHSAAETGCNPMPTPPRGFTFGYLPVPSPVYDPDPSGAKPITAGNTDSGVVGIQVGTPEFTAPVDIYLAIWAPQLNNMLWMIREDLGLQPASAGLPKWREDTTGPIDERLYGAIPLHWFARGTYYLLMMVTPTGSASAYYLWITGFIVP